MRADWYKKSIYLKARYSFIEFLIYQQFKERVEWCYALCTLLYSYQEQPDIYDNYYSDDSKQKPKGNVIVS